MNLLQELYDYLLQVTDLVGLLLLNKNHILYVKYNLNEKSEFFFKEVELEKQQIIDNLPNGFKIDNIILTNNHISFEIKTYKCY